MLILMPMVIYVTAWCLLIYFSIFPQNTLAILDKLDLDNEDEPSEESNLGTTKQKIWALFDEPSSSTGAKVSHKFEQVDDNAITALNGSSKKPLVRQYR